LPAASDAAAENRPYRRDAGRNRTRSAAGPLASLAALWLAIAPSPGEAQEPALPAPPAVIVPFAVEAEAADWARRTVPAQLSAADKLRRLSRALSAAGSRRIDEELGRTGTAEEVLRQRRANCVGYANLFVALSRELGLATYFALVDELPGARAQLRPDDGLALREGHLVAAWGTPGHMLVFDLAGESDGERLRARPITDLTAIAVFYSNRGIETLLDGRTADAVDWLRAAAELEPVALPSTWINLGVALRRAGDLEAADAAYQRALELDPAAAAAYRNLAALLAHRGRGREAAALLDAAATLTTLDSLAALRLARQHLLAGKLQQARGLYRRALEMSQRPQR
jgi:tetratricopeptide (TPR) repeat protein